MGLDHVRRCNVRSVHGGRKDPEGICEVPTPFGLPAVVDYLSGGAGDAESIWHIKDSVFGSVCARDKRCLNGATGDNGYLCRRRKI